MEKERGIIHLLPLLVVVIAIAVGVYLISQGKVNLPFLSNQPSVAVKTEYKNPFDKETQYVNPFDSYKNPFTIAK